MSATLYAVLNVSSSVSLVLVNKIVFKEGFTFPMTLTCFHFGFTVVFYRMLRACGCFERAAMPLAEAFKVAAAGVGSIGLMNVSLNTNSVGFYQLTKLAIIPCTLGAQALLFGAHASRKVKLSLAVLILGLYVATVTDVQLNAPGFCLGVLAVLTTTIFQLWQGSKQREFDLSATQLQSVIAPSQALQSLTAAVALENLCVELPAAAYDDGGGRPRDSNPRLCSAVACCSLLALRAACVRVCSLVCLLAAACSSSA